MSKYVNFMAKVDWEDWQATKSFLCRTIYNYNFGLGFIQLVSKYGGFGL